MSMTVVNTKRENNRMIVTIEGTDVQELVSPRAKKLASEAAGEHGFVGAMDQHSNPYFVNRKKEIKKDTTPFDPKGGDTIRIEYRVYNIGMRK